VNLAGTAREMIVRTPLLFESILYLVNHYLGDTEHAKAMALVSEVKQRNGELLQEFALCVEQMSVSVQLKEHQAKWILLNAISAQWKHDNPNLVVYLCNWESNPRLLFLDWRNDLKCVLHEEVVRHEQVDQDGHRRQQQEHSGSRNVEGQYRGPPCQRPEAPAQGVDGVGQVAHGAGRGAGHGADRGAGRGIRRGAYLPPQQPAPAGCGAPPPR
jgi:hypothetical protein